MSKKLGKVVFIGGIPFDFSEFDVQNIASTVGTVISCKLVFDQLTGKSKGYAFVEYADESTAASAVRNLNNYNIGQRSLKCGFTTGSSITGDVTIINPDGSIRSLDSIDSMNAENAPTGGDEKVKKKRKVMEDIPPLPAGIQVGPGQSPLDLISNILKTIDKHQLFGTIKDAQVMAVRKPDLMAQFLDQCPQLSSALVEILLLNNLVTPADISKLLLNAPDEPISEPVPEPVVEQKAQKQAAQEVQGPAQVVEAGKQPKTQKAEPKPASEPELSEAQNEQLEAIRQVIQLTPEQIESLPEEQKAAILEIQNNYKAGLYGEL